MGRVDGGGEAGNGHIAVNLQGRCGAGKVRFGGLSRIAGAVTGIRSQIAMEMARLGGDSISEAPEGLSLTDAQRKELERRLDAYRSEPDATIPWESLRQELLQG